MPSVIKISKSDCVSVALRHNALTTNNFHEARNIASLPKLMDLNVNFLDIEDFIPHNDKDVITRASG